MNLEGTRRIAWSGTTRVALPVALFLVPIIFIVSRQTAAYPGLLLGWDSSTYAWWAHLVTVQGPLAQVTRWNPPSLYPVVLSGVGRLLDDYRLAERILPLVVAAPLGYAYYRLTSEIGGSRRLGLLAAFLGGISAGTLWLVADLHANLLAYGIALAVGSVFWSRIRSGESILPDRRARVPGFLLWLGALAIIAYAHIWTYVVFVVAMILGLVTRRRGTPLPGTALLLALPLLLPGMFLVDFLLQYPRITAESAIPLAREAVIEDTWLLLGALTLPFVVVGAGTAVHKARRGNGAAQFVVLWSVALLLLLPVAVVMALPITRLWPLLPTPLFVALSLLPLRATVVPSPVTATEDLSTSQRGPRPRGGRPTETHPAPSVLLVAALLVSAPAVLSSSQVPEKYLVPYLDPEDAARLKEVADMVRDLGYGDPILVMFGPRAAVYAPLYRGYFGIEVPAHLAYYGKLQFLFSLPAPDSVYTWRHDPAVERVLAQEYRAQILAKLGPTSVLSRPIVVTTGSMYGLPPSERFLDPFELEPGTWVIPPGALGPLAVDSWRLFAWSDPHESSAAYPVSANWSISPSLLEWVDLGSSAIFEASYPFSMARGWSSVGLSIRLWDWDSQFTAEDGSRIPLAPLEILLDGRTVHVHHYADSGVAAISVPLGSLEAGVHRIEFRSSLPGYGVAVRLDTIEILPES